MFYIRWTIVIFMNIGSSIVELLPVLIMTSTRGYSFLLSSTHILVYTTCSSICPCMPFVRYQRLNISPSIQDMSPISYKDPSFSYIVPELVQPKVERPTHRLSLQQGVIIGFKFVKLSPFALSTSEFWKVNGDKLSGELIVIRQPHK